MDNKSISKILQKAAKLLELHEANPFKVRSYQNAAFNIEKIPVSIAETAPEEWQNIDGIGKNLNDKLASILENGSFKELNELLEKTPEGIVEMLDVKGVGPKKIRVLWKEYHIQNKDELLNAAKEGKLADWKGFGDKTQKAILDYLLFAKEQSGKVYYAEAENIAEIILEELKPEVERIELAGEAARLLEVVELLQFLVIADYDKLLDKLETMPGIDLNFKTSGPFSLKGIIKEKELAIEFLFADKADFGNRLIYLNSDADHFNKSNAEGQSFGEFLNKTSFQEESEVYTAFGAEWIPPELREGMNEWELMKEGKLNELLQDQDLKGTIHNHSTYSDGRNTLEEMARAAKEMGLEYLGISDHSKSAFYANGLDESRIILQHKEIDELNKKMSAFKIFKGIESDILNDGSLDYSDDVLKSFDFIVASIHSGLSMDERKATARLIKAIENPYTTFLGHPTGRLLLKRKGYPINHKMIIDACAENDVIIEINANPWRLDLSWEWVSYAIEKGLWLSINPDAHEIKGYKDMHYGVCVGRKGGLTKDRTFNTLSTKDVESYFSKKKSKA
ncbi:PHP domain-containing protein [Hyphobacterium sp. CCMP332]|nr:PHP domain-containing protein [Hyphobacterium sp. CCMP332]